MNTPAEQKTVRLHAIIEGYVQGVGFRANTRREATARGLTGWVKNNADGTVETLVEGPEDAVKAYARYLQHGPSAADVDRVRTTYSEPTGEFSGFNIRY